MKVEPQSTDDILSLLSRIEVDWQDDLSDRVVERLKTHPVKDHYAADDLRRLLEQDFSSGVLIVRSLLALSKDSYEAVITGRLGRGRAGIKSFREDPDTYIDALIQLGALEAMHQEVHRVPAWYDVLIERLRAGRGSAIAGQKRGRFVEDFVEQIVRRVFGDNYQDRGSFTGQRGKVAKCDFAIPNLEEPLILIEAKGYDATGSKMSDVIGDIRGIIEARRPNTAFILFTDGISWLQRRSDLEKLVEFQNEGDITRIYTQKMALAFEADLQTLKVEHGLNS